MNIVGAIGFPIDHSLSPIMHNAAFAALGMEREWRYDKMAIPPDVLRQSLRELRDYGVIGVNVTIPHKQAVMPYVLCDVLSQRVGAVNTIDFRKNRGTNTDVGGFMADLAAHDIPVRGETVIVLGAGGAARAVVYGLHEAHARLIVVNRTPEKAHEMLRALAISGEVMTLEGAAASGASLIVNCTSAGMYPQSESSAWSDDVPFPSGVTVYDTVYRPAKTRLMQQGEQSGGRAVGGLGMLVRQGAASFEIWTGQAPPLDVMFEAVQSALQEETR